MFNTKQKPWSTVSNPPSPRHSKFRTPPQDSFEISSPPESFTLPNVRTCFVVFLHLIHGTVAQQSGAEKFFLVWNRGQVRWKSWTKNSLSSFQDKISSFFGLEGLRRDTFKGRDLTRSQCIRERRHVHCGDVPVIAYRRTFWFGFDESQGDGFANETMKASLYNFKLGIGWSARCFVRQKNTEKLWVARG